MVIRQQVQGADCTDWQHGGGGGGHRTGTAAFLGEVQQRQIALLEICCRAGAGAVVAADHKDVTLPARLRGRARADRLHGAARQAVGDLAGVLGRGGRRRGGCAARAAGGGAAGCLGHGETDEWGQRSSIASLLARTLECETGDGRL